MSDSEYPDSRVLFGVEKLINRYKVKDDKIKEINDDGDEVNDDADHEDNTEVSTFNQEDALKDSIQNLISNTSKIDFDNLSDKIEKQSNKSSWSNSSRKSNNLESLLNKSHYEPSVKMYYDKPEESLSVNEKKYIKPENTNYNEKVKLLREWERISRKNPKLTMEKFDMDSDYNDIKEAINRIKFAKSRDSFNQRLQSGVLITTSGIENFVHKYNILGYGDRIIGLTINMKRELHTFDDIFDDLFDKWASTGRDQPPEIRLIINFIRIIAMYVISQVATNLLNNHIAKEYKKSNSRREMSPPEHDDETLELLEKYKGYD